jgi:hypothetical protein
MIVQTSVTRKYGHHTSAPSQTQGGVRGIWRSTSLLLCAKDLRRWRRSASHLLLGVTLH